MGSQVDEWPTVSISLEHQQWADCAESHARGSWLMFRLMWPFLSANVFVCIRRRQIFTNQLQMLSILLFCSLAMNRD